MGDLILGTFLVILILASFALYWFLTRKQPNQRSLTKFISLVIGGGGIIGLVITYSNRQLVDTYVFVLASLFFATQTLASFLYFRIHKVGFILIIFTLSLQIPILHGQYYSYRNQTLFALNADNFPGKTFDLEPGSYVHFISLEHERVNTTFSLGINLIPLMIILVYWYKDLMN